VTLRSAEEYRLSDHVTFGAGAVHEVPAVVDQLAARRVLLVCGRRSFEASGAAEILPDLERVATVTRWSDFSPNTDADDLKHGLQVMADTSPQLVLAVGGGSAMDMAKLLCAYEQLPPDADVREAVRTGDPVEQRSTQLVLVPTTSGSGSEATHFAVVYVGEAKHSIAGPGMLPDRVVLDPLLARSGSPYQRASSGVDALCQAIESLWAADATETSREHARRGLALALMHLVPFVADPTEEAAEGMCLASHLAGRAINISKTTAAHALSYGLTKRHGISHGHAVAISMGGFLEIHAAAGLGDLQPRVDPEAHRMAMDEILTALGVTDGDQARTAFIRLLEQIGLESSLQRLGVEGQDELTRLAAMVNVERLGNNPVAMDESELRSVLARAA
jgi:alcohol dehydrogenase